MTESKQKQDKKGIVLLIVIGTVFIVMFLANVVLSIITSHSRLTLHQVSRIQAYYASMAGMNYALEQLRTGNWIAGTHCLSPGCQVPFDFANDFHPASITDVRIILVIPGAGVVGCNTTGVPPVPAGITACVQTTAIYTYTPTP